MKNTTIIGLMALLVVGMVFSTGIVNAYRGDYSVQGPDYNKERHELMQTAFDSSDYNAWSELMSKSGRNSRVLEVVTQSNFETFVQAHEAGINGDFQTANALRAELGLNNGNGPKDGTGFGKSNSQGKGMGQGNGQKMQQNNFVDADNDGICDNTGLELNQGMGQGQGKGRR